MPRMRAVSSGGDGNRANSVWLSRLAGMLLLVWAIFIILIVGLITLALGGLQAGYVDAFNWGSMVDSASQPVTYGSIGSGGYGPVVVGTNTAAGYTHFVRSLTPPPGQDLRYINGWGVAAAIDLSSAASGFLTGALLVTFLWHWPRRRYLFGLLLPLIAAGFLISLYRSDDSFDPIRQWAYSRVFMQATLQGGGMMLGIIYGRPLARTLARMIIPPRPRQLLAFLWRIDGKSIPAKIA